MTYIVQCILRRRKCSKNDTKVFRTQMYILIINPPKTKNFIFFKKLDDKQN